MVERDRDRAEAAGPRSARRPKILIVDDEEPIRNVARELLAYMGYDVETAESGEEAVRRLSEGFRPDLVILDVIMPGMGGVAAFHKLREIQPSIPIIISSGFTDRATAETLMKLGLNAIVSKPYRMETLAERIRSIIG